MYNSLEIAGIEVTEQIRAITGGVYRRGSSWFREIMAAKKSPEIHQSVALHRFHKKGGGYVFKYIKMIKIGHA